VGVALFYNDYDNLLSVESQPQLSEPAPAPAHQVIPLLLRNGIIGRTTGGEVTGLWDVKEWVRVRGSYSLAKVDARRAPSSNDASTVRQLEGDTSEHKVVLQPAFTLPKDFELNLTYRYVSAIPNQAVPSYSTADVRLAKRLGERFQIEGVGRNLVQPSHPEYGGTPGPLIGIRRSGHVTLTWTP
jgi:iron complex outermembrane receptor protein